MGITGLIPFLEKSSKKTNISEFSGGTVAIDTYCWLHKGAFSCADKIIKDQATDAYVKYCMKFVNMLLGYNIKPILVFDGRHLPAKAETEVKRREARESNRKRAADLIKMGKYAEGNNLLRRSLDVSHKMALDVIKECQRINVDCIVAPYEADAQLAYLNIAGIADVVITEDSDLTLFGCKKIFFKMDLYGHGVLVEQDRLHLAMKLSPNNFHMDKFRYMCILSGCDYLASLPGIGLGKACKFIVKNTDNNIYNALQRLPSSLNMKTLCVTQEYREGFLRALVTFKHQLVYCPLKREQVRLNPPTADVTPEQLHHAGTEVDSELALQLALGNCDPFTLEKLHNFDPDQPRLLRTNSWSETSVAKHASIWSKSFTVKEINEKKSAATPKREKQLPAKIATTRGQVMVMKTNSLIKELTPRKRTFEESEMSVDEIVDIYKQASKTPKKQIPQTSTKIEPENCSSDEQTSPILVRRSNPFKKPNNSDETSPSLIHRLRRRLPIKSKLKPTVIDNTVIAQSEFFASKTKSNVVEEEPMDVAESMTTNVDEKDCEDNIKFSVQRVIIPETETYDDEMLPTLKEDISKDSGYKESSVERDTNISTMSCDDSITRNEPLHTIDNNLLKQEDNLKINLNEELDKEENNHIVSENAENNEEFLITRQIFSEYKSSMFKYESPDKRLKIDNFSSSNSQRSTQLSQGSSSRRSTRSNIKKNSTIAGQQSLLNMFGFQKKNTLKH